MTGPPAGRRSNASGYGYAKRSKSSAVPSVEPLSTTASRNGSVVGRRLSRQARVSARPSNTTITRVTRASMRRATRRPS